jgi:hypothetical protein
VQALLLPSEVEVQKPAAASGRRRGAKSTEGVSSGTRAAAAAEHLRANQTLSEFDTHQLNGCLRVMSNLKTEELMAYDPLLHAHTFPIFARLARRFLAPPPLRAMSKNFSRSPSRYGQNMFAITFPTSAGDALGSFLLAWMEARGAKLR